MVRHLDSTLAGGLSESGVEHPEQEPFTGKELDAETSLQYFGARYYMAALGRWGQVDPLADQYAGYSPYNYVLGNPNSLIDPDGRMVAALALEGPCDPPGSCKPAFTVGPSAEANAHMFLTGIRTSVAAFPVLQSGQLVFQFNFGVGLGAGLFAGGGVGPAAARLETNSMGEVESGFSAYTFVSGDFGAGASAGFTVTSGIDTDNGRPDGSGSLAGSALESSRLDAGMGAGAQVSGGGGITGTLALPLPGVRQLKRTFDRIRRSMRERLRPRVNPIPGRS